VLLARLAGFNTYFNHERTLEMLSEISAALDAQTDFAADVFERLRSVSEDVRGVTRASYGDGEQAAHSLMSEIARELGLEVRQDAAVNTYMTWTGKDRSAPIRMVGSHLDSVPQGGNYDGAAGVVSGLVAIRALQTLGYKPNCDISVMGVRAEESCWFGVSYIGSRSALGVLPEGSLETAKRMDNGVSLAQHIVNCGGDPDKLLNAPPYLDAKRIEAFLEPHIEQGPELVEASYPVGIVTGIRGNRRFPDARVFGEYAHCGGAPRRVRRDAVVAATEFVQAMDMLWDQADACGDDFACTIGKFQTNPERHAMTVISGEVSFTLDMRSVDAEVLSRLEGQIPKISSDIAARRGVRIDLGPITRAAPGIMDLGLIKTYREAASSMGVRAMDIPSGASHDSAAFADAGVPTAMLFIRNENGSHNPDEAMEISDFIEATKLLTAALSKR
jgi:N-carbamoyl-L-amino-acid hydrolase